MFKKNQYDLMRNIAFLSRLGKLMVVGVNGANGASAQSLSVAFKPGSENV